MLHSDLACHFLSLGSCVVSFHEEIILAQVLLHGQVLCDACRHASWRDELKHFLELFLFFLLLQLHGHFVFILGFNHKLLVPLNPIESGDFPCLVPFFNYFLDSRITCNHLISHPDDILSRLMALISLFTIFFSICFIAYLHLADFEASKYSSLGIPAHFTNFAQSTALSNGVNITSLPPNLVINLHRQGQAQILHHICPLFVPSKHHRRALGREAALRHRHRLQSWRGIHRGKLLARADFFRRLKIDAAESLAKLVLGVPPGDLLRFVRVSTALLFCLFLHKLRSAPVQVRLWRDS